MKETIRVVLTPENLIPFLGHFVYSFQPSDWFPEFIDQSAWLVSGDTPMS
jgi:hypothetical protein